jgi:amidohydrolase
MRIAAGLWLLSCGLAPAAGAPSAGIDALVDRELPSLLATYKALHTAPELSHHEANTSALLARELRAAGFDVTERVGKYARPEWVGYGVVAVMKNGPGPTVLVREDMDALPVEEKTGLPYASAVHTRNDAGQDVSVMHACGHDIHVATLVGTARVLAAVKDRWRGTLVLIGQPAEETIDGAKAMLDDGLYARFGRPDFAVSLHDSAQLETGKVSWTPGFASASSTSVEVVMRGRGGHGSRPEDTKDSIVMAAEFVLALQTIVSRENRPFDPVVVSVGAIHGGAKANIIPDEVTLLLTVRTYKEDVRTRVLAAIERIARGVALAAGATADMAPRVTALEYTPALYNDPSLARRLATALAGSLGKDSVIEGSPVMSSEDFGRFALEDHGIPAVQFQVGAVDPARVAESQRTGTPLPSLHSSLFAPVPEPTLRTAIRAMTAAVLDLMKPGP